MYAEPRYSPYTRDTFGIAVKATYAEDKDGNPMKNTKVEIHQKTHDFKYGANMFLLDLEDDPVPGKNCRDTFYKYFNLGTIPFYWQALEPEQDKPRYAKDSPKIYRRPAPDLCLEYCQEHGIAPKIHCLFYDKFLPSWIPIRDKDEVWRLYEKRFKEISERYAERVISRISKDYICLRLVGKDLRK